MPSDHLMRFLLDEGGAVTIDWVVLTAGVLIFGILGTASVISGSTTVSEGVGARLSEATVPAVDFDGP